MRLSLPVVYTCLASALAVASDSPIAAASAPPRSQVEQNSRRHFTIAAAEGAVALEAFAEQAGTALVYLLEHVRGVRTNAVEGWYTPLEALERMVADTVLIVTHDRKTGALTIRRAARSEKTVRPTPVEATLEPSENQPKAMKKRTPFALFGAWLALTFTPAQPASAQGAQEDEELGRTIESIAAQEMLTGTVTNAATGRNLVDGNRIADANIGGQLTGGSRQVQFQGIGSDTFERLELIKSPTPDLDADSIGGAVNLVSKNAFERSPERRLGGSFGLNSRLTDERDSFHRTFSFSYSEVFGGKLGVAFNYSRRPTTSLHELTNQAHEPVPNDVTKPRYTNRFQIKDVEQKRSRWGGGVRLDYKLNDSSRFFLNANSQKHKELGHSVHTIWSTAPANIIPEISSAYIMENINLGPLATLADVRVEQTEVEGEGSTLGRSVLDINTSYSFSKNIDVYLDVQDVLGEADRKREFFDSLPQQYIWLDPLFFAGINWRL